MAFAKQKPDRWAESLNTLAKVAGFTEKREVETNITINYRDMSDSQLEDALRQMATESLGPLLEHEPSPASDQSLVNVAPVEHEPQHDKD